MSLVDAHSQITVPEECALNITERVTVHLLSKIHPCLGHHYIQWVLFLFFKKRTKASKTPKQIERLQTSNVIVSGGPHYTIVQTVFRLGSKRTALPSTDFALVLYIGFSKAACPLLFSCTEQPVYWVLGVVLLKRQ